LGVGVGVLGSGPQPPIPNPQSPIPNPQLNYYLNDSNFNKLIKREIINAN